MNLAAACIPAKIQTRLTQGPDGLAIPKPENWCPTHNLNDSDIQYVCTLVEEAGRLAVVMREGVEVSLKSGPDDKVTAADIALSKLICAGLAKRFSGDCVVSEEDREHLFDQNTSSASG